MTPDPIESALQRWLSPLGDEPPDIYAVGGAVRDTLLGRFPKDVDIVCCRAAAFARDLASRQTPPAAVVDFSRKKFAPCFRVVHRDRPDDFIDIIQMNGPDLESDLRRRDFTINAMARPLSAGGRPGQIIDPLNGQTDIRIGRIRACSRQAIKNDPLRIIRAVRLAAELNFTIDPDTLPLMQAAVGHLSQVAAERVQIELLTLLRCPESFPLIGLLDDIGALAVIFPETVAMKGCRQNACHHLDVWDHCLETLKECERILNFPETVFTAVGPAVINTLGNDLRLPLLKLAALLHDMGKPATGRFLAEKKRLIFYGHARTGREMIAETADRLRISTAGKQFLTLLVGHHMRPPALADPQAKTKAMVRWFRRTGDDGLSVIILAVADMLAKAGPETDPANKNRLRDWADRTTAFYLETLKKKLAEKSLVSGHDLLAMGMQPGPELGEMLAALREKQDQGLLASRKEALKLACRKVVSMQRNG